MDETATESAETLLASQRSPKWNREHLIEPKSTTGERPLEDKALGRTNSVIEEE